MNLKHSLVVAMLGAALLFALVGLRPSGSLAQEGAQQGAQGEAQGAGPGPAVSEADVGTRFTYQGYLDEGGSAADGLYDFEFALYDAQNAGNQIGATQSLPAVTVNGGLFTVQLDFGAGVYGGGARWLQIGVRAAGGGAYTTLSPRQALTPAPSASSLPNVFTNEGINFVGVGRDFQISGNEVFGVRYEGVANDYGGMYVETSHSGGWPFYGYATNGLFRAWTYYNGTTSDWHLYNAGVRLTVPNEGGLRIGPSADYSLVISNTTGADGIRVYDTGDDGIQIGADPDYPNYGVYIPSPGVATYALWPNTADANGDFALFTVDNISAGIVSFNALAMVAKVADGAEMRVGDVAAVMGVAEPLPGASSSLPLVNVATGAQMGGVIGVVQSRMVWAPAPGKGAEGEMSLQRAEGAAQPGDYVTLVTFGIAEVRVADGEGIEAGERVTVAQGGGEVRALQTRTVEGMTVTEGAQVVGIALEAPQAGKETIVVFVTLR